MDTKAAVYCGTRNLYPDMVVAAKSLSRNTNIDEIYFLIEDPEFPYPLPDYVKCINVADQTYFRKNGPNVYKLWTWMVLMRAALSKYFPEHDRILSLDVDTIVEKSIDELWDLDLTAYYLAGVPEPKKSKSGIPYVNLGVCLFNLKMLRETHMDDQVIQFLNTKRYAFAEQDCINQNCFDKILTLPSMYNKNDFTEPCSAPKIWHFACDRSWNKKPLYQKYQSLTWDDIWRVKCAT